MRGESASDRRKLDRARSRLVVGRDVDDAAMRGEVRESWQRAVARGVSPDLQRAPADRDDLAGRMASEWLQITRDLARSQPVSPSGEEHLFAIFDARGRMLACEGDERVRARMAEINFAPGALWSEEAVGTNGPGTALALAHPVHIVGAEHYCEAWCSWHCAAAPIRDPIDGRVLGAIDISGPQRRAHPHTLALVRTLASGIEHVLRTRAMERELILLRAFAELRAGRGGEELAVVDLSGRVVAATSNARLRHGARVDLDAEDEQATLTLLGDARAEPVRQGPGLAGWTVHFEQPARPRPARRTTRYLLDDLVGNSAALAGTRRMANIAARNDLPVLLLGESGVGKEVVAQGIHAASARAGRAFVAVNCGALPAELLESELFGHAPGAYTGAQKGGAPGRFEVADGGTLFLDEIGELSHAAQAALLRVLQEGEVVRVGSTTPRRVDVRVIAATQREPGEAVATGRLRKDLYYRLAVLPCELPPLRDRREDIPLLIERFLDDASAELGLARATIAPEAVAALRAHDWPGNVRELKNLIRRLVASNADRIAVDDLPADMIGVAVDAGDPGRERFIETIGKARTLRDAAKLLGIGRSTLYRWMERYGLEPRRTLRSRRT